jgi:predicted regulator of Ras-like GTPase activity (Roadblock/LC7/MglB family)
LKPEQCHTLTYRELLSKSLRMALRRRQSRHRASPGARRRSHPPVPTDPPEPDSGAPEPPRDDCIALPLKAITDLFTPALMPVLHKQPSEHVRVYIPREIIRPQLAAGAVRITFAQLRAATPGIFFNPEGAPADTKVLLPLDAVLRQMMPSRREDQRLPSIPVNIPSIFSKAGPALPGRGGAAEPWYSQRRPTYDAPPQPDAGAKPSTPASEKPTPPPTLHRTPPEPAPPSVPSAPAPPIPLEPAPDPGHPAQILRSIRALDGVAGAFLASADGLLIAGDLPDANGNILAAFAPTAFSQLSKYSGLAQLGVPHSIDIHLAGASVHVRKVGKLYLGVLTPPAAPVPLAALDRISATLQPEAS